MNAFIKKEQYNLIKKRLLELNTTITCCTDPKVVATCKLVTKEEILNLFPDRTVEQSELLDITPLQDTLGIENYIGHLTDYVYGIPTITPSELKKLFKKEKKLKLPNLDVLQTPHTYFSWIDESLRKLFIVYYKEGKWIGMSCRLSNATAKTHNICTLCHHVGNDQEVGFVSPVCKATGASTDSYQSIGFYVCLDSETCNEKITATAGLENLLKKVGQLKNA